MTRGSNILGVGSDTLVEIREQLKSGKPEKPKINRDSRYSVKTDANGKAIVANLPAWAPSAPDETRFRVCHDGYMPIANSPNPQRDLTNEPELLVKLTPGQTTQITVKMQKSP